MARRHGGSARLLGGAAARRGGVARRQGSASARLGGAAWSGGAAARGSVATAASVPRWWLARGARGRWFSPPQSSRGIAGCCGGNRFLLSCCLLRSSRSARSKASPLLVLPRTGAVFEVQGHPARVAVRRAQHARGVGRCARSRGIRGPRLRPARCLVGRLLPPRSALSLVRRLGARWQRGGAGFRWV